MKHNATHRKRFALFYAEVYAWQPVACRRGDFASSRFLQFERRSDVVGVDVGVEGIGQSADLGQIALDCDDDRIDLTARPVSSHPSRYV